MSVCVCVCACKYASKHACTYVSTYMYMHTDTQSQNRPTQTQNRPKGQVTIQKSQISRLVLVLQYPPPPPTCTASSDVDWSNLMSASTKPAARDSFLFSSWFAERLHSADAARRCVAGSGSESSKIRSGMTFRAESMPLICLLPMHTSPTHPHACPRTKASGDRSCAMSAFSVCSCISNSRVDMLSM